MMAVAVCAAALAVVWLVLEITAPPAPTGLVTASALTSALSTWVTNLVITER